MNSVVHLVVSNTIVLYHFTVPKSCQMSPWRKQLASFVHIFGKLVFVVHLTMPKEQIIKESLVNTNLCKSCLVSFSAFFFK